MKRCFSFLLVLALCGTVCAQTCDNPNEVLLKNDTLPAVPSGLIGAAVIQGLCEGEAMGAVFDVSSLGTSVIVRKVAGALLNAGGANGINCIVNLKIYDGITWVGGIPVLGPEVLDWVNLTGSSLQFSSHAINEHALGSNAVTITSGTLVVTWFMDFNTGVGSCASGYTTNFGTDYSAVPSFPVPCTAPPQKNLIFIQGQGWRDAANATVSGFPICGGLFNAYNGNWIIRACVEPVVNPLSISFVPSNTHTVSLGFPTLVQFDVDVANNPGFVGQLFVPAISGTLGQTSVAGGMLPIAIDPLTNLYLTSPVVKSYFDLTPPAGSYVGVVPPTGTATGIINIPSSVMLPFSVPVHFTFLTLNGGAVSGVADVATLTLDP